MVVPAVVAVRVVAIFSTCRAFVSCRVSVCGDGLAVRVCCGDLVAFVVRGVHLLGFPFLLRPVTSAGQAVDRGCVTFPAGWGQRKRDAKFSQDFALRARPGPSDSTLAGGGGGRRQAGVVVGKASKIARGRDFPPCGASVRFLAVVARPRREGLVWRFWAWAWLMSLWVYDS